VSSKRQRSSKTLPTKNQKEADRVYQKRKRELCKIEQESLLRELQTLQSQVSEKTVQLELSQSREAELTIQL
jgi:hypothetical protein